MNLFLHRFCYTYATYHRRAGVDIRTVQSRLGHRDIEPTNGIPRRYLVEERLQTRLTAASWLSW